MGKAWEGSPVCLQQRSVKLVLAVLTVLATAYEAAAKSYLQPF